MSSGSAVISASSVATTGEAYGDVTLVWEGKYEASKRLVRMEGSDFEGARLVARRWRRESRLSRLGYHAIIETRWGRGGTSWRVLRYVCSRKGTVKARFPPAENPLRDILPASTPRVSALAERCSSAHTPSSTAVGNGCSGASRYATPTTTADTSRTTIAAQRASSDVRPIVKPPPWKLTMTGYLLPRWTSRS